LKRSALYHIERAIRRLRRSRKSPDQKKPELATWVQMVIAGGSLATAIFTFFILRTQLAEMRIERRAWVSSSDTTIFGDVVHDARGIHMNAMFSLKNTGHTPALDAFVSFQPSLEGGSPKQSAKACHDAADAQLHVSVFPGEVLQQGVGATISQKDLDQAKEMSLLPTVIACIAYKDAATGVFHFTPYNYWIQMADGSSPLRAFKEQSVIPANQLVLVHIQNSLAPD